MTTVSVVYSARIVNGYKFRSFKYSHKIEKQVSFVFSIRKRPLVNFKNVEKSTGKKGYIPQNMVVFKSGKLKAKNNVLNVFNYYRWLSIYENF
jgi:hypothetical protein